MASVDSVLVPMDGSPLSEAALRVALEEYGDAEITVLHVIDPTQAGYSYPIEFALETEPLHGSEAWFERSEELARELFDDVEAAAAEYGTEVATETATGETGRAIVQYATDADVDQIVIGSHGRDDPSVPLLGSVTEAVIFRSPVRVLLVR